MNKINSFFKISYYRKRLFLQSMILLIIIRFFFTLFSFSHIQIISKRFSKKNNNHKDTPKIRDILWSIKLASDYVPGSTCLIQAITAQILLSRYNHLSKIKIGVMKSDNFEAHAWLEIDDKIVLGESENRYVTILESNS
jgi:hypothetical protein